MLKNASLENLKKRGWNCLVSKRSKDLISKKMEEVLVIVERAWTKKEAMLNLSHRDIRVIPADIAKLTFTKVLLLNNNKILMPPEEISHLQQLEAISLEHNQLTVLPSGIAQLSPSLQFLNLSHNPLTYLSPAVGMLENLRSLWLGHTGLLSFPDEVCALCRLTHLSLEGNQIANIPSTAPVSSLKELQWLSLAKNKIVSVSFSLPCLSTLNLSENCLTEIPESISCPKLTSLNLRGNRIFHLPEKAQGVLDQKLELDIRDNPFTDVTTAALSWTKLENVKLY